MHNKVGIGQDSHRFGGDKPLILAGEVIAGHKGFLANSDGDVIFHAITNALSGITTKNILGKVADEMCSSGITDSAEYVLVALGDLKAMGYMVSHVSISIECSTPKISPHIETMRANIAHLLETEYHNVGITATTGEGLSDFGKGLGIFTSVIISAHSLPI